MLIPCAVGNLFYAPPPPLSLSLPPNPFFLGELFVYVVMLRENFSQNVLLFFLYDYFLCVCNISLANVERFQSSKCREFVFYSLECRLTLGVCCATWYCVVRPGRVPIDCAVEGVILGVIRKQCTRSTPEVNTCHSEAGADNLNQTRVLEEKT